MKKWAEVGSKPSVRCKEGTGYWLGVTCLMTLNEDAICTHLLRWGETSTDSVEEERKGWSENGGITT